MKQVSPLLVLLLTWILSAPLSLYAQQKPKRNEIQLSVGKVGSPLRETLLGTRHAPSFNLTYMHHNKRHDWSFGIGMTIIYTHDWATHIDYSYSPIYPYTERVKEDDVFFALMCNVKREWYHRKKWSLYSRAAFGFAIEFFEEQEYQTPLDAGYAMQFSPVGFQIGNRYIKGFCEVGMGYHGIVTAGVAVCF